MKVIILAIVFCVCCTHIKGYKLQFPEFSNEIQDTNDLNHLNTIRKCEELTDCEECLSADCGWRKVSGQKFACSVKTEWSVEENSCPLDGSYSSSTNMTTVATTTSTTTTTTQSPPSPSTDCEIAEMVVHHFPGPCKATITCKNGSSFTVNQCLNTLTFISAFTPSS